MKKAISLFLTLVLCLGLCMSLSACGNNATTLTKEELKFVGCWDSSFDKKGSFILLSSGKAITNISIEGYMGHTLTKMSEGTTPSGNHGTWEVEGDFLIIYHTGNQGTTYTRVYKINNEISVTRDGIEYVKSDI